jgi:uncharacterized OB-fold protein
MDSVPAKNLPVPTAETAEYWAGCQRHELLIQRCTDCAAYQFYPRLLCTRCSGRSLQWVRASGRGTITSFTIVRRAVSAGYAAEVPYVVALIRLEEGPTLMSNVVGCGVEEVVMGMPVEVVFDDWPGGVTVPKFRPASAGPGRPPGR